MNASRCLNPDCLRLNLTTSIYCDRCRSKLKHRMLDCDI
ncbi:MAG: 4-Cys prefix domain-containing protein [Spirulinaceae cyanobacterium]